MTGAIATVRTYLAGGKDHSICALQRGMSGLLDKESTQGCASLIGVSAI
jgi:hypothetical protein